MQIWGHVTAVDQSTRLSSYHPNPTTNVLSLSLKTATEPLLRTVCGSEFQTAGAEHQKSRFANVVVVKG